MILATIFGGFTLLMAGMAIGRALAEKSAVLRSDCSTPHHMQGGFYYIVPESEYIRLRKTIATLCDLPIDPKLLQAELDAMDAEDD